MPKKQVSKKEEQKVLHNLSDLSSEKVVQPSSVGRSSYDRVKAIISDLATKTLKGSDDYISKLKSCAEYLANLSEAYASDGQSKVATKFMVLRNKCLNMTKKIQNKSIKDVNTIKTEADSILRSLLEISPKSAEHLHEKAGIRDQSKAFAGFDKKRVKLDIDQDKIFKLDKVPLLLLFKNKITPSQKAVLKAFDAHFYQGTNGVSLPGVPVLILNKGMVNEKDYQRTAKSIFNALKRPDLSAFFGFSVSKRNAIAFPVFEPKIAEAMSAIIFDSTQSKELWVE